MRQETRKDGLTSLVEWLNTRLGLSYPLLRPVPNYAINPFYWLGALTVVAFVIQGLTGVIMMLYYVPSPAQAFSSTQYVFQNVFYGRFLETVHLYTAYAMIMLAFMHMMRGYFVSVHKKPRELMWLVGMIMGFITLGFGFTGYLLPWTVVSKSATDVGIGMMGTLPPQIASFVSFLVVGAGGDATELLRFYDLHVVILPAVLLVLLTVKMYMLETHGISEPAGLGQSLKDQKLYRLFPDVSLYLLELAAIFGSAMLLISVLFPLNLPPLYTPELAAQFIPQPDWYFLWIYQILKIAVFEGPGLPVALTLVTLIFVLLLLLPFVDRGRTRKISERFGFVTLGLVFIGELVVLAYWGLVTPGQIIPTEQAVLVLGGTALIITTISYISYKIMWSRATGQSYSTRRAAKLPTKLTTALCFVALIASGCIAIGGSLDAIVRIAMNGTSTGGTIGLILWFTLLSSVLLGSLYMLYRIELPTGLLRKRIRLFELEWRKDETI
jgi:quinol-cytochrome oxidoreductase complex cytochrome b subunit